MKSILRSIFYEWEEVDISTENRLNEIKKKLDKLSAQENRRSYKPILIVVLVIALFLIFFVSIKISLLL
jgi:hypothetical protein